MALQSNRSGSYVRQTEGYRAFVPRPLPPDPPLQWDGELLALLSAADRALGRLDGSTHILPNPDLFVAMYVRQEAVLSSQIEGTQASLTDVLEYEVEVPSKGRQKRIRTDVAEVVNHVSAMNYGLQRLRTLPLSLRLIAEIHSELLRDVRGAMLSPGEFRRSQNWIGPGGCTLKEALFVPPPPHLVLGAMGELEMFLHSEIPMPLLIKVGLAHAQFETIHPFLDGNGRMGRLLITFLLCEQEVLTRPLLYLSHFFKRHRAEYYDRLQAVRDQGHWEAWLKFFLRGVEVVANSSTSTARRILELRERHRSLLAAKKAPSNSLRLLDYLYEQPIVNARLLRSQLSLSAPTVHALLSEFELAGLLREKTGQRRNRSFEYASYLSLFEEGTLPDAKDTTGVFE